MRSENSVKNSITSTLSSIVTMILGFVSQAILIRLLGAEYLGLNGLFTNILTMLSFFELGIGSAIVYHLYKPIAEDNKKEINILMNFYKKSYTIISIIVFGVGLVVLPFLNIIVGKVSVNINIHVIYIMFLINTSSSYLLSYKKNIIMANQKNYIINIIHIIYLFLLNTIQLAILFLTKNYYLYLGIKFIFQMLENFIGSYIASKLYPYINLKSKDELDKKTKIDITNKVKALLFHKIGYSLVSGTDNIIISSFLGVKTVGLYSNYYTIIASVNNLFSQIISSATASIGNLLVSGETEEKKYSVFKKIRFLNFWISCFSAICILVIITPFIKIWIGEQYLLSFFVTVTLVFNYFQKMQRSTYNTFKDSAGIWVEDKFVPLVESVLNIAFSIILLKIFGLAGVFMGTIISGLALWCYSYPKFVYKKLFNRSYVDYAKETIGYIVLFIVLALVTYYISVLININNVWLQLISNTIISITIPNIILVLIFRKTESYKYFIDIFKKLIYKIVRK